MSELRRANAIGMLRIPRDVFALRSLNSVPSIDLSSASGEARREGLSLGRPR
jgi:hypothetical protein